MKSNIAHFEPVEEQEEDSWMISKEARFQMELVKELKRLERDEFSLAIRSSFTEYIHHHAVPLFDQVNSWSDLIHQLLWTE